MHREFINLVSETVDEAHSNGINLFYESLEHAINKETFIAENTLEETLTMLFNESEEPEDIKEETDEKEKTDEVQDVE